MVKVQSQQILKFKVQNSMFKVKAPTPLRMYVSWQSNEHWFPTYGAFPDTIMCFLYDIRMFLYYSAMNNGPISLILSFKVEQLYNLFRLRHESFKEKHYEKTHIVAPHDVHIGGDLCTN